MKTAIQEFIDAYNDLRNTVAGYQKVSDGQVSSSANLYGDSLTSTFNRSINELITKSYGSGSSYSSLGALGIKVNEDNNLELDEDTLDTALKNNFTDVKSIFYSSGGTTGLADSFYDLLDDYNADGTGYFTKEIDNIKTINSDLETKSDAELTSADAYKQTLIDKYSKLETQIEEANIKKRQVKAILNGTSNQNSDA